MGGPSYTCGACGNKIRKPGIIINGEEYWTCGRGCGVFHEKCCVKEGFVFKTIHCPKCGIQFK